jgi:MFS family permease
LVCQVTSLALWFSASAAVPGLLAHGEISGSQASLLTSAVQVGFVFGTLLSAWFGLADILDPRRLFAASAAVGAALNGLLLWTGPDATAAILLRGATGICLAGIYPVGIKLAAGWADKQNMGLMIGALVGALTLGSSLPHLFNALSAVDWKSTILAASVSSLAAASLIGFVDVGPGSGKPLSSFKPSIVVPLFRRRSLLLVNIGYLGHMWELYAMWAWIGPFLVWALGRSGDVSLQRLAPFFTFLVIAAGAAGCFAAGIAADRIGRTRVTIMAMSISATCAATIGFWADAGAIVLVGVAILWGIAVVADSAQFSAAAAELADPRLTGTVLTIQTSMGFLLTFFVIQSMPLVVDLLTWRYAFAVLAVGPAIGIFAMYKLRSEPDAEKIANGLK